MKIKAKAIFLLIACRYNAVPSAHPRAGGKLVKLDYTVIEHSIQLTLAKKACPSSGAPYTNTTVTQCGYGGAKINSADNDWVMAKLS